MQLRALGNSGLDIAPLVFGGNVFGWTLDEPSSFSVLDAFVDAGFNAIDTADVYSRWVPGNTGGESETIIGRWLKARPSMRDKVVIMTKVGMANPLTAADIARSAEQSLERLGIDVIDLYQSHQADTATPPAETLGAYSRLIEAGKVRAIGASNFDAQQLGSSLAVARQQGLPSYQSLQPEFNLYDRAAFGDELRALCLREGVGVITYYSLASGFLSGKYRSEADFGKSQRGARVGKYLDAKGMRILAALDQIGAAHSAKPAEVALAWLMSSPGVTAPIASATSVEQVASFSKAARLELAPDEIHALDLAGA